MDYEPYFKQYEALVKQAEDAFEKVKAGHEECVRCKVGCADCCHALFDLTLIEALYIKARYDEKFSDSEAARHELNERANEADRKIYKLKRRAFKDHQAGKSENEILEEMSVERVRCPLLNAKDQCDMYEFRPITCRLYGIPTVIGGRAHTCGLSEFKQGQSYPTVKLDAIHQTLYKISFELTLALESKYPKLAEMLVPLSMALLTDYTDDYLGSKKAQDKADESEG